MTMNAVGFVGSSGIGKTSLIEKLIPIFTGRGLRVATIKHAHKDFDVDQAGKDSWRHRKAGASQVLISSSRRWVLMSELEGEQEPDLESQLGRLSNCDLVIVEGFKRASIPTIEVWRASTGRPVLYPDDPGIVAIATDSGISAAIPVLDLNQPIQVATFVMGLAPAVKKRAHG